MVEKHLGKMQIDIDIKQVNVCQYKQPIEHE